MSVGSGAQVAIYNKHRPMAVGCWRGGRYSAPCGITAGNPQWYFMSLRILVESKYLGKKSFTVTNFTTE